jgi:hypothetical protein
MDLGVTSNKCCYCKRFFHYTSTIIITQLSQLSLMMTQPAVQHLACISQNRILQGWRHGLLISMQNKNVNNISGRKCMKFKEAELHKVEVVV